MRIVLDTNVFVAAFRSKNGASFEILRRIPCDGCQTCLSLPLFMELQDVLTRPDHLPAGKTPEEVLVFLQDFASVSHLQDIHFLWRPFLPDPEDDMLLELAFASKADYLVTHNLNDFTGAETLGVMPICPRDFLTILRSVS